jgi:hypothetical protein
MQAVVECSGQTGRAVDKELFQGSHSNGGRRLLRDKITLAVAGGNLRDMTRMVVRLGFTATEER